MSENPSENPTDPIRQAARLISAEHAELLERRLKQDIVRSIGRLKPAIVATIDFESDVMHGSFFANLDPPLQGIAIARTEGALAFYNRVGWRSRFLHEPLATLIEPAHIDTLSQRYHASTLHDLAYIHPRHLEKLFGKPGAAALWESLKRFATSDV